MIPFLKKLLDHQGNSSNVMWLLAEELKLKVAKSTLTREIQNHPNPESLLSISDVLNIYGIDNVAYKINVENIKDLPVPFVATIKENKSESLHFTLVKHVDSKFVHFHDPYKNRWIHLSLESFKERFGGTVLLVEVASSSKIIDNDYDKKKNDDRIEILQKWLLIFCLPAVVLLTSVVLWFEAGLSSLPAISYLLLSLSGTGMTTLLLYYAWDRHNPVIQKICNSGKKVNCGAILTSKAAKIAGLSWSAIGFSYFAGQLITALMGGLNDLRALSLLSWLNAFALPYVFYSLYYQWRIAKHWCLLCLSVQSILVIQFLVALMGNWYNFNFSFSDIQLWMASGGVFTFLLLIIRLFMSTMERSKENNNYKVELQRLKRNSKLFQTMLINQKNISRPLPGLGITLGRTDAKHRLVKVCNPYCGPCATAHEALETLLSLNNNIQLQIIFTATNSDSDIKTPPVKHLLAIAQRGDEATTKKALDDWYLARNIPAEGNASNTQYQK